MQVLKYFNYALAFSLELVLFFSVGFWGYSQGKTSFTKWIFAIILFLIVITIWAVFAAPKSNLRFQNIWLSLFRIFMFSMGTLALIDLGKNKWSIIYSICFILSVSLSHLDEKGIL
ncbi:MULTISPECIES: YrdB family protein [Emticicia]|uniref:YrdB family protein n=1 Tax=Emticicia TaxID=312278 RepID=UPI0007D8A803|nr:MULTISPECIES: YrdB family protein [Emticicia]